MKSKTATIVAVVGTLLAGRALSENVKIKDATEFLAWADKVSSLSQGSRNTDNVVLEGDLDFGPILGKATQRTFVGQKGDDSAVGSEIAFAGTFDGQYHSVLNLGVYNDGTRYPQSSLFGLLQGATVRNLRFDKSCTFNGKNAAALAYRADGGQIENVRNEAPVYGRINAAGIVVEAASVLFSNVTNTGLVVGGSESTASLAAGIVAHTTEGSSSCQLEDCHNSGFVFGRFGNTGGLVAHCEYDLTITDSSNDNLVVSTLYEAISEYCMGGLVGKIDGGKTHAINRCVNNGDVNSSGLWYNYNAIDSAGGMVGYYDSTDGTLTITNSMNLAYVQTYSTTYKVGGFVGTVASGKVNIYNSVNKGTITSETDDIGGQLGCNAFADTLTEAKNVVNLGHSSKDDAAKFAMWQQCGTMETAYSLEGTTTSPDDIEPIPTDDYFYVKEALNKALQDGWAQWKDDLLLDI